jgi:hypothetical protein
MRCELVRKVDLCLERGGIVHSDALAFHTKFQTPGLLFTFGDYEITMTRQEASDFAAAIVECLVDA